METENSKANDILNKKNIKEKCTHNKLIKNCKICTPENFCIHIKNKYICTICNVKLLCIHNKLKYKCKICNVSKLCIHNNFKYSCKKCVNKKCSHNISKQSCKICNRNRFCEHNNQKHQCKICRPDVNVCIHDKNKYKCSVCNLNIGCKHKTRKEYCKICDGKAYCIHGKERYICVQCKGKGICSHNVIRRRCKLCKGSQLCKHEIQKRLCLECDGKSYCPHKKQYARCKICDGSALCKSKWCEKYGIKKYNGYCMTCCLYLCPDIKISRNYKTKEKDVVDRIIEAFPNFSWIADKKIIDGCSRRRPDLLLDLGSHIIILEVDENKHTSYDCSCENKRLMELSQDLGHRPIVFIRFNPDGYIDNNGKKILSCWRQTKQGGLLVSDCKKQEWLTRIENLKTQIQYWIDNHSEKTIEIIELYY